MRQRAAAHAVAVLVAAGEQAHAASGPFQLPVGEFSIEGVAFELESSGRSPFRILILQVGIRVEDALDGGGRGRRKKCRGQ